MQKDFLRQISLDSNKLGKEYKEWSQRDLSNKHYVYLWVDGIYFNVRLEKDRPCLLVLLGATKDGTKELVGIYDGHRESKISWMEALNSLKRRGLSTAPSLAIGDGALGFWAAIEEAFPSTRVQRCWVHKTANVVKNILAQVQCSFDPGLFIHIPYNQCNAEFWSKI